MKEKLNEQTQQSPDYRLIFSDIIDKKFPHKKKDCERILKKDYLSALDIITLNQMIFGVSDKEAENFNQKHKSYNKADILEILNYQKNNRLSNLQTSLKFKTSRNTIAKWRKLYNNLN
ncbi:MULTISPECIES: helix-turn-helix domain-containing protein [Chryseobacterium]|uniref:Helix-turn-helix domain-containing protein n=1 Tax=Chryseobacterium taihuense TaxID=1141221 RepID=A0A4U8WGY6_9FLAO|nr:MULTISPECIES: helix-turn-helix domain-containing protein [Chryseobacterium]QQV02419.1 helix-turn-helix domain-containing protein [Chryseobacterium sp. FDAARGOS 1104]VFB04325.1 Uncharacterised protein [Chryseobacterium taihuense]